MSLPHDATREERFWEKVRPDPGSDCLLWFGVVGRPVQHGRFWDGTRIRPAHRWIYEQTHGPVSDDLVLDHLCGNPRCVNIDHLEPVTQGVNVLRGKGPTAVNARKTECKRGHEFTPENTIWRGPGRRERGCRTCINDAQRARAATKRAAA